MKAQGNITTGKTIDRHLAEGSLRPFMVAKFYGPTTPENLIGQDVEILGWRDSPTGGYIFTIRTKVGASYGTTPLGRKGTDKVGIYADQEDAKADFYAGL